MRRNSTAQCCRDGTNKETQGRGAKKAKRIRMGVCSNMMVKVEIIHDEVKEGKERSKKRKRVWERERQAVHRLPEDVCQESEETTLGITKHTLGKETSCLVQTPYVNTNHSLAQCCCGVMNTKKKCRCRKCEHSKYSCCEAANKHSPIMDMKEVRSEKSNVVM